MRLGAGGVVAGHAWIGAALMTMSTVLPQPPVGVPIFNQDGTINIQWQNYFLSLNSLVPNVPPIDAKYWVSTFNTQLTDEVNIGALSSGYLKVTVAAGVAAPSTVAAIPGGDVTGSALTRVDDTNVTLTLGGSPFTALLRAASLTLGWTGQLGLSRGGTNANLSATGGASQVLRQSSAGAAVTVSQLATTDISGMATGTYTPTLTGVTNVDASTAYACQYVKIGTMVSVSGRLDIDTTASGADTELGISLPVASNLTASNECAGTASALATVQQAGAIVGDATNDRAALRFFSATAANTSMFFNFLYQVL